MGLTQKPVSRRWVIGALLSGAALPAMAEAPATSPRPKPRGGGAGALRAGDPVALLDAARLGGAVGYVVADARDGHVIESHDGDLSLPPASVAKAITTLYALERLGGRHRFATRLLATGPVSGGIVQGDLVLAGSGDPTLSTDTLGDMAQDLAAQGVRGLTGRFLAYTGALPDIPEISDDQPDHVGYNPAISGLNLNFNRVHFEWKRGAKGYDVTMDARAERFVPAVRMARMRVVNRDLPVYTYAEAPGADNWTVALTALGKGGSRWLPVRHPAVYTAEVFQTLAKAQGITLPDAELVRHLPEGATVAERFSAPLTDVLRDMLRFSTNMTAEVVGLTASGAGSLAGSAQAMNAWAAARFGIRMAFRDHSGLAGASRITAADMVTALVKAQTSPTGAALRDILREVGIRDASGRDIKNHPVKVQAKTGTLNFVSGLAGYARAAGGADLVFAIFCADTVRRDRLEMSEREQPAGGPEWTRRARILQGRLIERWAALQG
jgi:D-alanyl-D-alanine carboxypeptidase/D-alanyl-D-alanine-endopeptidase (penicillin-binding protein 4)